MEIYECNLCGYVYDEEQEGKLWYKLLIKGVQLAKIHLNEADPVNTQTIIGSKARHLLVIETPIYDPQCDQTGSGVPQHRIRVVREVLEQ